MWERSINLWLRPPPWGERAATAGAACPFSPLATKLLVAYWLRRPVPQCFSVSAAVAFLFFFLSSASSAETIYHFFGRLLQTLQDGWKRQREIKSNLGSRSNMDWALANWNTLCSDNTARSKKSNQLLLPGLCRGLSTITRISEQSRQSGKSSEPQPVVADGRFHQYVRSYSIYYAVNLGNSP